MKTISNLTGTVTEVPAQLPAGQKSAHHAELKRGLFVHVGLSHEGLTFWRGNLLVRVPMSELTALAVQAEPELGPATEVKV